MVLICKNCFSRMDGEIDENNGILQCIICGNIIDAGKLKIIIIKSKERRKRVEKILGRRMTKYEIRCFNINKFTENEAFIWAENKCIEEGRIWK